MTSGDDAAPSRLLSKPTWLIAQASIHAHRLVTEALAGVDASGYHYRLLAALDEFGPASQAALGRRTEMDRSDVAAALNELADGGYVKRAPDPDNRRRNIVTITPAGHARLEHLDRVLSDVQEELLAPLSPRERRALADLLTRVLTHRATDQVR